MLKKKYNITLDTRMLEDAIVEAGSLDRAWRQVLQRDPKLRGNDYNEKDTLAKEKQIELGYQIK